jgi:hypothetical protein
MGRDIRNKMKEQELVSSRTKMAGLGKEQN